MGSTAARCSERAPSQLRPRVRVLALLLAGATTWAALAAGPPKPAVAAAPASTAPAPSIAAGSAGEQITRQLQPRLLQVRTLLKTQDSQTSVGSGFLVSDQGHLITNYHVVSEYALQPGRHRLTYAGADGRQGTLQLLAIDAVNDLALLKLADPAPWRAAGVVAFRPADEPLPRGARIFSLGNPLDVGFAVTEGAYNGPVERGFLETLFFGGALSPGMSGGPAVDERGRLIGVNVATRRDGEQVSFLVPAAAARRLLERSRDAGPIATPQYDTVARQLQAHGAHLVDRFVALPWRPAGHARYRIPVPQEQFMRCWGQATPPAAKSLQFERSDCTMDSRVFVNTRLQTGFITVAHEAYDGRTLGALRFAQRYSFSFGNEAMGRDSRGLTAPRCVERSLRQQGLPLRAVACLRAYKKLPGLHDLSVLVATLDGSEGGVQGRLDAHGISFDASQRLTRHYLEGFGWTDPKTASR